MKSQGLTKVVAILPEGNNNVCATFHGNLSKSFWDSSLATTNFNLMVTLEHGPLELLYEGGSLGCASRAERPSNLLID